MAGEIGAKILEQHKLLSLTFGALSVLCWSYYNVMCDLVVAHFDNYFILFNCILVNAIFVTPILKFTYKDLNVQGAKQWASVCCFGVFDVLLILLMSYAFQHAPIGDAACLFAMRVLWTPIVEAFVTKKCITPSHAITMLLAVSGAILITQPAFLGFSQEHDMEKFPYLYVAYLLALIAGVIAGLQFIFLSMCPDVHWSVWQLMMIPAGIVIAPIVFHFSGSAVKVAHSNISLYFFIDLFGCFFIAWFDFLGRMCRTVACKEHTASTVSLVSVLEIPFTYAWGWLYSGQAMGKMEIGGAVLVMCAVFLSSMPCFSNLSVEQLQHFVDETKGESRDFGGPTSEDTIVNDNSVATSGYDSVDQSSIESNANGSSATLGASLRNSVRSGRNISRSFLRRVTTMGFLKGKTNKTRRDEEEGLLSSTPKNIYYQ